MLLRTALSLAIALPGLLAAAPGSEAGVSYDFVFRTGGGGFANGNQYTFPSVSAANSGTAVSDVFLRTTDALVFHSISVGFDDGLGLGAAAAEEWSGLLLTVPPDPPSFHAPIAPGVTIGSSSLGSFDGATVAVPPGPPSLAPGTYNIGTILWDTSGASAGQSAIFFFLRDGLDDSAAVRPPASNNIVTTTGSEVLGTGFINIVPEPGTAGLVSLALVGLGIWGRRRAASGSRRKESRAV